MRELRVDTGYRPRPLQAQLHRAMKRFNVLVCHRRFGKTVLCVNHLIDSALRCRHERPRFAYIAPYYGQAKKVAWDYLQSYTATIPAAKPRLSNPVLIELPGDRQIQVFGADNPDSLRGPYLDGVVLDEAAYMAPRVWSSIIRPQLVDRRGWAIFIGTPAGRNAFCFLYENAAWGFPDEDGTRAPEADWYGIKYPVSKTGVIDPEELADARRDMTPEEYDQEFECSFEAAIPGSIYGALMRGAIEDGRITRVPHDPALEVETWWDLGHSDATAIWWVQRAGTELHIIDYYESHNEPLEHYARVLRDKQSEARDEGRDWVYGRHIWPHDGGYKRLESGGRSLAAMMSDLGFAASVQGRHDRWAGINRVRQTIPLCWFDEQRCSEGLDALRAYRKEEDDKRGSPWRRYFREKPHHDWSSHGCDAFRTGVMAQSHARRPRRPIVLPEHHISHAVV